jgi:hypothetical protein
MFADVAGSNVFEGFEIYLSVFFIVLATLTCILIWGYVKVFSVML